jgi:SAM-dependent methyltransferase
MNAMYSSDWFESFAETVPAQFSEADVEGVARALPCDRFPRVLDVGCGIGRVTGPLAARGYAVVGLDVSVAALRSARRRAPGPRYVALDQRDVGAMRWQFDGAIVLWNSLGFSGRSGDLATLRGLARVLRPGGRLVLDLYHPGWLARNERAGERDPRGPEVRRWLRDGRLFHAIRYPSGRADDIQFDVYAPEEMRSLCARAGLPVAMELTSWDGDARPSADHPRYQLVCARAS